MVDLFSGIGGIRAAFQSAGCRCVFSSEIDKFSRQTYAANFGEEPHGDISDIPPSDIPEHEVLAAGFPCQPFSLAGVSKKLSLGREHGFRDVTQGTLFFKIAEILDHHRTPIVFLENVKNLRSHDRGRTFEVILRTLGELDYSVEFAVVDARAHVPQHRERIYIVALAKSVFGDAPGFTFPSLPDASPKLGSILEPTVAARYVLSDHLWKWHQDYAEKHRRKGNGFGYGLVDVESTTRTLSARYYKDGAEILFDSGSGNPRRLTPRECARLMGFDDSFQIPVSDTQAYRQFGNSVVVPVVRDIAVALLWGVRAGHFGG